MHGYVLERLEPLLAMPKASVLDVGAGSGYLLTAFAQLTDGPVHGIDNIPE